MKLLKLKIQIWFWEMFCNLIDRLTMDLVTEKSWVKKDVPPSAGLRPEESERPAMVPHKVDPVTPDRPTVVVADSLEKALDLVRAKMAAERHFMEVIRQEQIDEDIAEMLGPVKEGDPR